MNIEKKSFLNFCSKLSQKELSTNSGSKFFQVDVTKGRLYITINSSGRRTSISDNQLNNVLDIYNKTKSEVTPDYIQVTGRSTYLLSLIRLYKSSATVRRFDRELHLKANLNSFLEDHLKLPKKDYYSNMNTDSFLQLKSVLGDINNIFTLKLTVSFIQWISDKLELSVEHRDRLLTQLKDAKPSANGFDLEITTPINLIAEVKCNIPVNGGSKYGAKQKEGILRDIFSLQNGKTKSSVDPQGFMKFMVFLDKPEIRKATEHLISNLKSESQNIRFIESSDSIFTVSDINIVYIQI